MTCRTRIGIAHKTYGKNAYLIHNGNAHDIHNQNLVDSLAARFLNKLICPFSTAVTQQMQLSSIKVYPNPGNGHYTLQNLKGNETIEIYDYKGQHIKTILNRENTIQLDLSSFADGLYLVNIRNKNTRSFFKLMKS